MSNRHEAYHLLLEISNQLRNSTYERRIVEEKFILNDFRRTDTGKTTVAIRNLEYTNLSTEWFAELSTTTILFAVRNLIPAVKHFNLLWHWPSARKTSEKIAIKELVDHKLIFRTEVTGIYLINPLKIWRGNPITAVECTKSLLQDHKKPAIELIKDLRPADRYSRTSEDNYNLLANNGITPNLLDEPEPGYNQ